MSSQRSLGNLDADILPGLLDEIKQNFEVIATSIMKSNSEHYPIELAQQHVMETEALIQKLNDVLKERNLSGFPADLADGVNIAAKQKQIIDQLQHSWNQSSKLLMKKIFGIMQSKSTSATDVVALNVGGYEYTTSRMTLTKHKDSTLAKMFLGCNPTMKDEKGRFFIDRNGKLFDYLLQYLRTGFPLLPDDYMECEALTIEADYYGLDKFSKQLDEHKSRLMLHRDGLEIVKVNVGGRLFVTTRKTLTAFPNSLIGRIFSGNQVNEHRYQGTYFFDRDPELFAHVLQFLRNKSFQFTGTSKESQDFLRNLLCEARYFKLEELVSTCFSLLRYCDQG